MAADKIGRWKVKNKLNEQIIEVSNEDNRNKVCASWLQPKEWRS